MLQVQGLTKRFDDTVALANVSFHLPEAQYVVIAGPSGSGKSTLLRVIAGLVEIESGSINLNGQNLTNLPAWRRPVSTVFQQVALFPHMSVAQNIAFGMQHHSRTAAEIRHRTGELLDLVGLTGLESRTPTSLSGGQQQRVALARSLAVDPQIVLLDEPLGALDGELRHFMRRELRRIQRESGVTFLHVSHDREEALTLADHLLVLANGRVIGNNSPEVLRCKPGHLRVANLVGLDNVLPDPTNDALVVVFAPEHVVLGEGDLRGEITAIHKLGAVIEHEIMLTSGHCIRHRISEVYQPAYQVAEQVQLHIRSDCGVIVERAE